MTSPETVARSSALIAYMAVVIAMICVIWFQPGFVMDDNDPTKLDTWRAVGYIFVVGFIAFGWSFMHMEYQ